MLTDKIKEKMISLCLNKNFHAFKRKHIGQLMLIPSKPRKLSNIDFPLLNREN